MAAKSKTLPLRGGSRSEMLLQVLRIGLGLLLPLCVFWLLTVEKNGMFPEQPRQSDHDNVKNVEPSLRGNQFGRPLDQPFDPAQQVLDEIMINDDWENTDDDELLSNPLEYEDGEDDDDVNIVLPLKNVTQPINDNPALVVTDDQDPLTLANLDLIRTRPRNLRIVFVGDSITRYQYLSLAYFLRFGRWFDPSVFPNNLVNAHSFHHDYHPDEDWNEFFMQSNRMLQPMELCDCVRKDNTVAIERRYFYDTERNNQLVYINISGKSTLGYEGLYGRANPRTVFDLRESLAVTEMC